MKKNRKTTQKTLLSPFGKTPDPEKVYVIFDKQLRRYIGYDPVADQYKPIYHISRLNIWDWHHDPTIWNGDIRPGWEVKLIDDKVKAKLKGF